MCLPPESLNLTTDNTPNEIPADASVTVTFAELGLDPKIIKALNDMGYERPTPIQAQAIPHAMQGKDVLGIAQTGTGKTGAFVLPTVHKMAKGRARARMPRCLIICPTRELAAQVAENVEMYGKYLKLEMALLIGGVSFAEQDRKLSRGVDVLIATPGRLLDQFERGKILLTGVQTLVVDEADRMLDMGFIPDIEKIFKLTPFTRQVLFFSATMPAEIKRLVDQFLHQPATVQIARKNMTAKTVTQRIVRLPNGDAKVKRTALRYMIDNSDVDNGIVFCNRKRDVDIVAKSLNKHGHSAEPIHGDLAQSLRTETLDRFKNGEIKILVASDVAARGLDVASVSHVFNYDVPSHSEDYVHRIGRTGRAGREGDAVMFVARLDEKNYQSILELIKVKEIEEIEIPGLEDFPKEGKVKRGGKNDSSRGRGSDRGRGRAGGQERKGRGRSKSSEHSSESATPKATPKPEKAKATKAAPARAVTAAATSDDTTTRRKAPARRAAPGRKPAPSRDGNTVDAESQKPADAKETTSRTKKAPGRRPAPGRKAAPSRDDSAKSSVKSDTVDAKAPKPADAHKGRRKAPTKSSSREEGKENAPQDDGHRSKRSEKPSSKPDNAKDNRQAKSKPRNEAQTKNAPKSNAPRTRDDQARENERQNKQRGRNNDSGKKADFSGFGDDVPAFFKAPLIK